MKTLTFNNTEVTIRSARYAEGNPALLLICADNGEGYACATANLPGLARDEFAIKDYSENTGMLNLLLRAGIIAPPHRHKASGFVLFPICERGENYSEYVEEK